MKNQTAPSFHQTLTAVGIFASLACAVWAVGTGAAHYRLTQAEAQYARGHSALAFETLEPSRTQLTGSSRGCQALINVYSGAHRSERLEWATQACLEAGIQVNAPPEIGSNDLPPLPSARGIASPVRKDFPSLSPATPPRTF